MLPATTDIIIVGAGPTGLALAIGLQQAGIAHVLLDRLPQGRNTSRAAVIHAHTLETLESLGVTGRLVAEGLHVRQFAIRERDSALLRLDFSTLPSAYNFLLMLPQDRTEAILAERLGELGGTVHRGVDALRVETGAKGASVVVATPGGERRIAARYVVGADGLHSIVRDAAGIGFPGGTYEEQFVLADVEMEWANGAGEVAMFFAPAGGMVVAPLPGGRFRIVATDAGELSERPGVADIQHLVSERGPARGINRVLSVAWSSTFRIHHRVANAYRSGPLFLVGDAAHVHSPAGGQGMNTGLVDAVVLARLLARVVRDGAPDQLLDKYNEMRRPAAVEVLALAGRMTRVAVLEGRLPRALRNLALRLAGRLPAVRRKLVMAFSGLARKHRAAIS